jgi:uncharacterized protein
LRTTLGRLFGSAATGGLVGFLAWLFVGSIAVSLIVALIAFVFAMFADMVPAGGGTARRGGWSGGSSGGSWSGGGGSSSSDSGGFSGGGGSFGGGGASGSW